MMWSIEAEAMIEFFFGSVDLTSNEKRLENDCYDDNLSCDSMDS